MKAQESSGSESQAVVVHLNGTNLPHQIYEHFDLATLEDDLAAVISRNALGEFDGNELGVGGATLFMYGPDAEKLFAGIEQTLRACPLCRGARVIIRRGGPGARQRQVEL